MSRMLCRDCRGETETHGVEQWCPDCERLTLVSDAGDTSRAHWLHDCSGCEFLGGVSINGVRTDSYVCRDSGWTGNDCLVTRLSDDPSDYKSGPIASAIMAPDVAATRALYLAATGGGIAGGNPGGSVTLRDGRVIRV